MSIVACRIYDDKIRIGSDSITVRGDTQDKAKDKFLKLAEVNGMVIGSVGFCEENGLFFTFCMNRNPKSAAEDDVLEFICEFAEWKKKRTEKHEIENDYLIVFDSKVFYIQRFFVKEIISYEAIGAGMDYALSALYLGHDVEKAIEVACELSIYCEKPIKIIEIKK